MTKMKVSESDMDSEFIEFATSIGKTYGFDLLTSKIFAILYLEPGHISMEELAEKTGYSLASICNSMKVIGNTGFLKEIHTPKTKKLHFTVEKDFSRHISAMIEMIRKTKIIPAKEVLPGLIEKYRIGGFKEKQKVIENYYKQMLRMDKIVTYMESQL
jgi:DNA-binding transcriptional regulator GbsR (MarR family)